MRVIGIDPSSTNCGVALVHDGRLLKTWLWQKNKKKSSPWNICDYYEWLFSLLSTQAHAHMACVEFLSVERNAQTTRKVSHFQAISVLACKQAHLVVIEGRVSSARAEALGRGDIKKEDAHEQVKKMFPQHKFKAVNRGGMDETDAVVLALAGPGLAEGK